MKVIWFCLICALFRLCNCVLEQVHVIFRHGDRTPDDRTFPNDIYANETYYPPGRGLLTLIGKQQEYKIGQNLRKHYDRFLGRIYDNEIIEARSTDYQRTQMSLQLVLAALWPPTSSQKWHLELNWQPIPYLSDQREYEKIIKNVLTDKKVNEKYKQLFELEEVQKLLEPHKWVLDVVAEHTGEEISTPFDIFYLYFTLLIQDNLGLLIPDWTTDIYPEALEQLVYLDYHLRSYNNEMLQLSTGGLFNKVKREIISKIKGNSHKKLFLYSAHEYTLALFLTGLGVYQMNPHIPNYGSYITVELHKIDNIYGVNLYYNDYTKEIPVPIKMPDCQDFCPIDKFFQLVGHITTE